MIYLCTSHPRVHELTLVCKHKDLCREHQRSFVGSCRRAAILFLLDCCKNYVGMPMPHRQHANT